MSWFEDLTGCREESPDDVREQLAVDGNLLHSHANGRTWSCGELETPTLAELRARARQIPPGPRSACVREVVADVQQLHRDEANAGGMFQVASQFNLLEMTSPRVTPERGVGIYERDHTQGPACAIAAGAGTIYRNYFVEVNGQVGQTAENQIDCLAQIGIMLGNSEHRLWKITNGYALPSREGLEEINRRLSRFDETELEQLRDSLRIGVQSDTQVTLGGSTHVVSQAYCSAMPVSYTEHTSELWAPFATLILEAAYEATICAAITNAHRTGNRQLFLTLLGGGAFGNETDWITDSIRRAVYLHGNYGLEIAIVSYGSSKASVRELVKDLGDA